MHELQGAHLVTLRRVWADYQMSRGGKLRATTVKDYDRKLRRAFYDWFDAPLESITKDMIEERHRYISQSGEALANLAMRILKALFNYAASKYDLEIKNPVRRLTEVRAWNRVKRRQSLILPTDLPAWNRAVMGLRNTTLRDYLLVLLFTGMRRSEAATMRWEHVNFRERTLSLPLTKNGDTHTLPLSEYLYDLLSRRRDSVKGDWVFPGRDAGTHISLTSKDHARVIKESGVQFMLHDLRRTFATTARRLKIDIITIKRLLNHRVTDVTAGYLIDDTEDLREPMEAISRELLKHTDCIC